MVPKLSNWASRDVPGGLTVEICMGKGCGGGI